jgi:hypothetical protein
MRPRDTSPILRVVPKDQETGVPRDATVLVTASRPVDLLSTQGLRVRTADQEVDGVIGISSDGRLLFWSPARALAAEVQHRVTISGIRDERGALFEDHSSTFVTGLFSYMELQLLLPE